jgi:hypothetical protein
MQPTPEETAMMYRDLQPYYEVVELDDEDSLEGLDAWTLSDFDDVLYGPERSTARLRWSEEPDPS